MLIPCMVAVMLSKPTKFRRKKKSRAYPMIAVMATHLLAETET